MKEFTPIKEGKVREIYDIGDSLIITATDRISAFDVILKNKVTTLEEILTHIQDGQTILFGDWHGELSAEEVSFIP